MCCMQAVLDVVQVVHARARSALLAVLSHGNMLYLAANGYLLSCTPHCVFCIT